MASGYFRCAPAGAPAASHGSGDVASFFNLASLTKPMTALAFEAAGLDRSASLESFLPQLRGSRTAGVPLELLFAHRAAAPAHLPFYEDLEEGRLGAKAVLVAASDAHAEAPPEHRPRRPRAALRRISGTSSRAWPSRAPSEPEMRARP